MTVDVFKSSKNLLPYQGEVFYFPDFFDEASANNYLSRLNNEISWKQEPIKIFGKEVMQPRLTAWFGEKDYSYSGIKMRSEPFPGFVLDIKNRVEAFSGECFNSVLLNFYRDRKDSMGWHRDNEKMLGINPAVASVSFGATRYFQLRNYKEKSVSTGVELQSGSLLFMRGETQHYWQHAVAKYAHSLGPRINLTFRKVI